MIIASFDDLIWDDCSVQQKRSPGRSKSAKIENQDGSSMFVVETVTIEIEEQPMNARLSQPLTLGWAIGLSCALIVASLSVAGGTYALIHSDVKDVRTSVDSVRDGASSDLASLRSDMRSDYSRIDSKFDKVADKLDKITEIVTETKIQQAKKSQE